MAEVTAGGDRIEGGPWFDSRHQRTAASRSLLIGFALLMVGNGLQASVLGLRATAEGFSPAVTGVVMAGYFAGFLIGTHVVQRFLREVGHIRVFAALTSLGSGVTLVHVLVISPLSWFLLRLVFGACMAGLFVVAESWLNDLATNETRGRLMSAYLIVAMGGAAVGQLLLDVVDPLGFAPFVIASVIVSFAALPVALSATSSPPLVEPVPVTTRELLQEVPTGLVVAVLFGFAQGTVYGAGSLYGALEGLSDREVALVLALPGVGCILLTFPWGRWSDNVGRRPIMLTTASLATVASVALVLAPAGGVASWVLLVVLGGTMLPLYSLAVSYTADWIEPHRLTGASAVIVRASGLGAVLGPLTAGLAMETTSPVAFFWLLAGAHAVIAGFVVVRMLTVPAITPTADFVPVPSRASAVITGLMRRRPPRRPDQAGGPAGADAPP